MEAGNILSENSMDIGRGHAEVLMPLLDECLGAASVSYPELARIAVTIGPGSFTGVRVGLSVARGLGLGLDIPVAGISTLEAASELATEMGHTGPLAVVLDARRNEAYYLICKSNVPGPDGIGIAGYPDIAGMVEKGTAICGSGAPLLNEFRDGFNNIVHAEATAPVALIARLGAEAEVRDKSPEPLYLRPPDARPQSGLVLSGT